MIIKLKNGDCFKCLEVRAITMTYQGVIRDGLIILFRPEDISLNELEQKFTTENCQRMVVMNESEVNETTIAAENDMETNIVKTVAEEYVSEDFTIRVGFGFGYKRYVFDDMPYSVNTTEPPEPVNWIKLLQTSLTERSIQNQQEVLDALVVEALMREAE